MNGKPAFPTDLYARRTRYDRWLAANGPVDVTIVQGVSAHSTISLDAAGLASRGWTDLPIDWVPPDGAPLHGGYGEDRAIYNSPHFQNAGEPRTLHLGLDIFAAAGTEVFAPLDGWVHSLKRNDNAQDYGPTLILEHSLGRGLPVFTLYGHLDMDVLNHHRPGDVIQAGAPIARLGDNSVNGGWAPHLHFQLMLDMLGHSGDFPGVCQRSQAQSWFVLCPDPRPLLGL